MKAASCTVKSAVPLQIGDAVSDTSRPGVYITDISLAEPLDIQEISFKNYYTAYLTVRLQRRRDASAEWVTCLRNHCLMSNPHAEAGSHDYFSIHRHQPLKQHRCSRERKKGKPKPSSICISCWSHQTDAVRFKTFKSYVRFR
ncbi:nicolin-1-like isoform X2 [Puntigrus tetrazona]|nr:nicolin-1-like isoform X2 [Puntigrus tetrazona]XP_043115442.1 nicolin-1-like isoform X2 [Puntigrus tetrazona]